MLNYSTYTDHGKLKLKELLELQRHALSKSEQNLQKLLEEYPFLMTGAISGIDSSYSIFSNLIISQPEIKSFGGDRSPDFLVITWNSLNLFFNFIELEDPSKKIFRVSDGNLSGDFNEAFNQITEWQAMNTDVRNYCTELLRTLFNGNFNNNPDKTIHINFILAFGFSDEVRERGERANNILQQYFAKPGIFHTTYSRIIDTVRFEYPLFSVKKNVSLGRFEAIGWTPLRNYTTDCWSDFHNILGKEEIVAKSDMLSNEEKTTLINQIRTMDRKTPAQIRSIIMKDFGHKTFDDLGLEIP